MGIQNKIRVFNINKRKSYFNSIYKNTGPFSYNKIVLFQLKC